MDFEKCTEVSQNKIISVSEKGRKFIISNLSQLIVKKIQVDGCLIDDNRPRCDWLFEVLDNNQNLSLVIYVELKGKNIQKAYEQLMKTLGYLKNRHKNVDNICAYIVASRVPRASVNKSNLEANFWKKYKTRLMIKTKEITIDSKTCQVK